MNKEIQNLKLPVRVSFHRGHKQGMFVYKLVNPSKEVCSLLDEMAASDSLGYRHQETDNTGNLVYVFYKREYLCSETQVIPMSLSVKDGRVGFWISGNEIQSKLDVLTGIVDSTTNEKVGSALANRGVDMILARAGLLNVAPAAPVSPVSTTVVEEDVEQEPVVKAKANMKPE